MYEARRRSHYQIIHSHRAPSIFGPRDPNVLLFDPHFVSDLTLTGSRCGVPGRSCSVIWSTSHDLAPPDHRRGRTGELSERTNDRSRGFALVHARSRCLFLHIVQITTKQTESSPRLIEDKYRSKVVQDILGRVGLLRRMDGNEG